MCSGEWKLFVSTLCLGFSFFCLEHKFLWKQKQRNILLFWFSASNLSQSIFAAIHILSSSRITASTQLILQRELPPLDANSHPRSLSSRPLLFSISIFPTLIIIIQILHVIKPPTLIIFLGSCVGVWRGGKFSFALFPFSLGWFALFMLLENMNAQHYQDSIDCWQVLLRTINWKA